MQPCLFCATVLGPTTRAEHPILDSIGGRFSSPALICDRCNELLGAEIDGPLAEALAPLRYTLCVRSGSRDPPPTLRKVPSQYGLVDVTPGKARRSKIKWPTIVAEGDNRRSFEIQARTLDEAASQIAHTARRLGIKTKEGLLGTLHLPTDLRHQVMPFTEPLQLQAGIGDPEHFRSIMKSALEVFALAMPVDARGAAFAAARDYVLCGAPEALFNWTLEGIPALPFSADELGEFSHVVTAWAQPGASVAGHVTIFGHLHFVVRLADGWSGDALAVSLAVDPIAGRDRGLRTHSVVPPPLDLDLFAKPMPGDAVHTDRVIAFMNKVRTVGYWRQVDTRLRDVISEVTAAWVPGTILGDEHFAQLANATVDMLQTAKFGKSEPIDVDDFLRRVVEVFEQLAEDD